MREFSPDGGPPELLLHPSDRTTGVSFSLIALTQAIVGGLLTAAQARRHAKLIAKHLLLPDGAHLMDKPLAYHGGSGDDLPPRRVGGVLRPRDRADVCPRAFALRGGDERSRRPAGAVGRARRRQSDRRHRACEPRLAAATQRLFQQQRRGVPRSLRGLRQMGSWPRRAKWRSTAVGASIPAVPGFTSRWSSSMRLA